MEAGQPGSACSALLGGARGIRAANRKRGEVRDDSLVKHAMRIQGRAVRRAGELLEEFDARGGDQSKSTAADTFAPSQREAAQQAGISKRQQVTAVRVARVPKDEFEALNESDDPPRWGVDLEGTKKRAARGGPG